MNEENIENDTEQLESSLKISSNNLFTTIFDVKKAIFRYLSIHSVETCSLVCQAWTEMARLTKSRRSTIHPLLYIPSSNIDNSNILSDFDQSISLYIKNKLWSIPKLALVVSTNNIERKGFPLPTDLLPPKKTSRLNRSQRTVRRTECLNVPQALIRHLNKSCQVLMIASQGIIGSNDDKQSYEIESENDGIGILLLPKFSSNNLGIYPFVISHRKNLSSDLTRSDLHEIFGGVPIDIPIRCVIIFLRRHQTYIVKCLEKLIEYYSINIAIIGGFVDKIHFDNRENLQKSSSFDTCGIVLTGNEKSLNIQQVIIDNEIKTRDQIRNKIKQLKSIDDQQTFSFALQISCVARGSDFYNGETNVECSEFRKLFPHVPLIGIFGNGEIGHNYLFNHHQQENMDDLFHSYSTIFSLVTLQQ